MSDLLGILALLYVFLGFLIELVFVSALMMASVGDDEMPELWAHVGIVLCWPLLFFPKNPVLRWFLRGERTTRAIQRMKQVEGL